MTNKENAYIGVDPIPNWQAEPINTPEEVAKLEEVGILPKDEDKTDANEGDLFADGLPPEGSANDGSTEVDPLVVEARDGETVDSGEGETLQGGAPEEQNPADKNGDGLLDQPTL